MAAEPRELLRVLLARGVDFVVIGGVAVQAHGHLRTTRDVDIIVRPTPENAERLAAALDELEATNRGVDAEHLHDPTDPATFAQAGSLFVDTRAGMLDVMQDAAGAPRYDELRSRALEIDLGTLTFPVVGLDDLIALKRASGRRIDLEDIAVLTDLQRMGRSVEPDLSDIKVVDPPDPAVVLLGDRPARRRLARAWDDGAQYVYLYRDEFGRPSELEADNPLGRRPEPGTRQRRVWDRLVEHLHTARRRLAIEDSAPGDLGEDLDALARNSRP
jgi:predicted nucleotidyltransferase